MTWMFRYSIGLLFLIFLTSCSLMESETTSEPNEIEGELTSFEEDGVKEESEDQIEDLDLETSNTAGASEQTESAFSDIEDFNEDLIEEELSDEQLPTSDLSQIEEIPDEDLDVEAAQPESMSVTAQETAPLSSEALVESAPKTELIAVPATNQITNLEYKSQDSGGSVVISAERPFEYQVRDEPQFNQTIIEAMDVQIAPRFKQPYIAKDFGQPVATINAYQDKSSNVATIVIQYKAATKPQISMMGNTLMVNSSGVTPASATYAASADAAGNEILGAGALETAENKRINIQLDDILVSDLIKIIADEIGFNVIVDEDVTGKVNNVKLIDVPWKEAMSSILGAQGLSYERKGQIVRVAQTDKLTKELNSTRERLEAETGARTAASALTIKVVPVSYADITSLVNQVTPVLTPNKGKVTPDLRSSSIVIYDLEDNVKRAEQIIRSLDVKPIQVLVEGRIIEAKSSFLRQFGVNWTTSLSPNSVSATGSISGVNSQGPGTFGGGALANVAFGTVGLLDSLSAALAVYEQEEKIKILSSPRIVTLNKEKAIIQQTEQVPIRMITVTQGAPSQETVTFRDVILKIDVTPQVTFNADMILDIQVRRDISGADFSGSRAINTREAQAKVLVKDGHSVVMGGILSMDEVVNEGGVPFLKDIPLLGYLFKTKRKEVTKNELVIFLQPKILNDKVTDDLKLSGFEPESTSTPSLPPRLQEQGEDTDMNDLESEIETL
jgi:type IV pilus assembly protein PilQ